MRAIQVREFGGPDAGTTPDGARVVALVEGGGYAERALARPELTFAIPDAVSDGEALALVLQGTTAWHVLRTSARLAAGELRAIVGGTYPLAEARRAHEDLRARRTMGKLVLDPRA